MVKTKKPKNLWNGLATFLKSKDSKIIFFVIAMASYLFYAFALDSVNWLRDMIFPYLSEASYVKSGPFFIVLSYFPMSRFNISMEIIFIPFAIFIFSAIFKNKIVGKLVEKKGDKYSSPKKANKVFSALYIGVILLSFVLTYFIGAFLGAFRGTTVLNVFYTVLFMGIFCGAVILAIVIAVTAVYTVIGLIVHIIQTIAGIDKDSKSAKEDLFPALTTIDTEVKSAPVVSDDINLNELALRFQSFAINNHQIYYELPLIRSFIAGMAATKLIILEGLSGTGKSMLPRMFTEFTNSQASFTPVQATWRDKTDILGFYSDFTKSYKSTDFLKNLYSASYTDKINTMVLDEINLSRIEYYFADFLSILEYPIEDWKIKIYEPQVEQKLPAKLDAGYVRIPANTWFIGTANTDDSTFTITDKVYDRAIIIDFSEKISPIKSSYNSDPINLSAEKLQELLDTATSDESLRLTEKDLDKFIKICDFTKDAFDIRFGNRIMVQIEEFVPVYVALGGTKEEALDFMFARKILRKLIGAYEDYIKDELIKLTKLINELYGKGVFKETERLIAKITKRLV